MNKQFERLTDLSHGSKDLVQQLSDALADTTASISDSLHHAKQSLSLFSDDKEEPPTVKLHLQILEGRRLAPRDSNGKSDPYCIITLYDNHAKTKHHAKTEKIKETLNPKWKNASFTWEIDTTKVETVKIDVWDWDFLTGDDHMGTILIPIESIPSNQEIFHWFPLHQTAKHNDGPVTGEILVSLKLHSDRPRQSSWTPIKPPTEEELKEREEQRVERNRIRDARLKQVTGELLLRVLYNPPLGQWEGLITINIVKGKNLAAMDPNGKSDPYVVLQLGKQTHKTTCKREDLNPVWNETKQFYVYPRSMEQAVDITVYDWDVLTQDDVIGTCSIVLSELIGTQIGKEVDMWVPLGGATDYTARPALQHIGKAMARDGWKACHPVLIIPGIASSSLQVMNSDLSAWVGERIWLSLGKIGSEKLKGIGASLQSRLLRSKIDETEEDMKFRNAWLRHLCLGPDGFSDPEGIKVRPITGRAGVAYLDPGTLTGNLSYVMGPLIENLVALGYTDDNLIAMPYDWRIPPHALEERDQYFTKMRHTLEQMYELNFHQPTVVLCHSMGNRTFQYFLNFMLHIDPKDEKVGRAWIDKYVHTFLAVGAPFLGAPKLLRAVISGDRMGLDSLIKGSHGTTLIRALGSTPFLLPVGLDFYNPEMQFVYIKDAHKVKSYSIRDALSITGASRQLGWFDKYYKENPLYGGKEDEDFEILKAPPVKRLYHIYGINLETEMFYAFRQSAVDSERYKLDAGTTITKEGYVQRGGMFFETKNTPQYNIKKFTGVDGSRSGDGTVPYSSLNYCQYWKKDIDFLRIDELEGVPHREILNNCAFFEMLVDYICTKPRGVATSFHEQYTSSDLDLAHVDS